MNDENDGGFDQAEDARSREEASRKRAIKIILVFMAPLMVVAFYLGIAGYGVKPLGGNGTDGGRKSFVSKSDLEQRMELEAYADSLEKYERMITACDIRIGDLKKKNGIQIEAWPKEDRDSLNFFEEEMARAKEKFNSLAKDYNAKMAETKYRHADYYVRSDLSTGKLLHRKFEPYR